MRWRGVGWGGQRLPCGAARGLALAGGLRPLPQPVAFHDHGLPQDPQHTATGQVSKEPRALDQWEGAPGPSPIWGGAQGKR